MNLYVGNLSPDTTEKDLLQAFKAHGTVSSVSLPGAQMKGGRGAGRSRGYGFVVMSDQAQGQAAVAKLNLHELHGLAMTVLQARPAMLRRHRR